jgi:ribosomal-protein-serine acetyltransferase
MNHELIAVDRHMSLVQILPEQADQLFELTDKNRKYLGEFLPWPQYVKSADDSREHILKTLQDRADAITYTYGIEVDGVIAGDISLRNMNTKEKIPEIGYWMSLDYAGKGLMTKAVSALTDYGLRSLDLEKIIIRADPANIASNRVAEKAGYSHIGEEVQDGKTLNVWSTMQNKE